MIVKTGPPKIDEKKEIDSLFGGHLQNIMRLANEGKLALASPFQKNKKSYRGIFILNVKKTEQAKNLPETDPAIKIT